MNTVCNLAFQPTGHISRPEAIGCMETSGETVNHARLPTPKELLGGGAACLTLGPLGPPLLRVALRGPLALGLRVRHRTPRARRRIDALRGVERWPGARTGGERRRCGVGGSSSLGVGGGVGGSSSCRSGGLSRGGLSRGGLISAGRLISIGGSGSCALPGPNRRACPHSSSSSLVKLSCGW